MIFIIAEIAAYLFSCWTIIKLNKCWKRLRKRKKNVWRKHPNIQTLQKKRQKVKQIFSQPLESNLIMVPKQVEKRHRHCQRISIRPEKERKLLLNQNNNKPWHTGSVEALASPSIRKPSTAGWILLYSLFCYAVIHSSYLRLISLNCNKKCASSPKPIKYLVSVDYCLHDAHHFCQFQSEQKVESQLAVAPICVIIWNI